MPARRACFNNWLLIFSQDFIQLTELFLCGSYVRQDGAGDGTALLKSPGTFSAPSSSQTQDHPHRSRPTEILNPVLQAPSHQRPLLSITSQYFVINLTMQLEPGKDELRPRRWPQVRKSIAGLEHGPQ